MEDPAGARPPFGRRTFPSLRGMLREVTWLLGSQGELRREAREGLVPPGLRERLMLAVTSVNDCRYCSWYHARLALRAGVSDGEVDELLCGAVGVCPEGYGPALLYALHWAESDGRPGPETRARVVEAYGPEGTEAIERALRAIRTGNLLGNTVDYVLFRLTGGRLGRKEHLPLRSGSPGEPGAGPG